MYKLLAVGFLLLAFSTASSAVTYKCKDKDGVWKEEACPDYEQRKQRDAQRLLEEHAKRNWAPAIGMQSTEVERVLKSPECRSTQAFKWCGLWKVNTTQTANSTREQWVFTDLRGLPLRYLYFHNGVLVTIQD